MVKIELIFTSQPDDTSVPGVINAAVQVEFKATGLDTPRRPGASVRTDSHA